MQNITHRQAALVLLAIQFLASLFIFVVSLFLPPAEPMILPGSAAGALLFGGLLAAYWRGWENARHIAIILLTLLVAFTLPEPFVTRYAPLALAVPLVLALLLVEPVWVVGNALVILAILLVRAGGSGVYAHPVTIAIYVMVVAGLVLSRLMVGAVLRRSERQAQELRLLEKVHAALARELNLTSLFHLVVESIAEVFGYTLVSLFQVEGETLVLQHQVGYDRVIQEIPISRGVMGEVVRTGKPVLLKDVHTHPEFLEAMEGIVSEVCVPLFDQGRIVGVLNVETTHGLTLSPNDLQLMGAVGEQVGIAFERSRLYFDLQQRNEILAALHETTLTLMNQLELSDVLQEVVAKAAQLVNTPHAHLFLVEPDGASLKLVVGLGVNAQYVGLVFQPGEGLAGKVAATGASVVELDYHAWPGRSGHFEQLLVYAAAGVPIIAGTRVVGVLGVDRLEPGKKFTGTDVDLLNRFAQIASIALENARLYTQAQQELAERKRAEQGQRESQARLEGIVNTAMNAIITTDEELHIVLFNPAAEQIFGCPAAEALGGPLDRFIPERFREAHRGHMHYFSETDITKRKHGLMDTFFGLRADGVEFPIEAFISQTEIDDGKFFTVILQDISHRKQAEAERQTLLEVMREANATPDLGTFMKLVHRAVSRVVYAENFFVALYDKATGLFEEVYLVDQYDAPSPPADYGKSCAAYVFRTGRPLLLTQKAFDALAATGQVELVGTNSPSWVGVPLKTPQETIGVMVVQDYQQADRYSERDVEFLASIGGQVALAVERMQAQEALWRSEKRFSSLFENSPIGLWEEDLSAVKQRLDALRRAGVADFRAYLPAHPEVVAECLALVDVTGVNQATLKLHRASSKGELLGRLEPVMTADAIAGFQDELIMIAEGRTTFSWEGTGQALDGTSLDIQLFLAVVPGYEETLSRVIVSIMDITDNKRAHAALHESERFLRQIIDLVPHFIFSKDEESRFLLINQAVAEAYGTTTTGAIGKTDADFSATPEEAQRFHEDDLEVIRSGQAKFIPEEPITDARGQFSYLQTVKIPFQFGPQKTPGILGVSVDITERKRAEMALQERERFLVLLNRMTRAALEVPDFEAMLQILADQLTELFNADACCLVLWDAAAGRSIPVAVSGSLRAMPPAALAISGETEMADAALRAGRGLAVDDVAITSSIRRRLATLTPFQAMLGLPFIAGEQKLGAAILDFSRPRAFAAEEIALGERAAAQIALAIAKAQLVEQVQRHAAELEQRVAERTAQLEAANQELETFSYSVSHDLRAPLRGVNGFSQVLLEKYGDQLDAEGLHTLRQVRSSAERMGQLIEALLRLSRISRVELRRGPVSLSALARETLAGLRQAQPERAVEWAIADDVSADCDEQLARIVLDNLLGNAWKFSAFSPVARIEFGKISGEESAIEGRSVYFVRDNGAGFDMEYAGKLFGAFQRLHSESDFPGMGIGLATVQRIVQRHGGRIWA